MKKQSVCSLLNLGAKKQKVSMTLTRMQKVATILSLTRLANKASECVYDEIMSITPVGEQQVYDLSVEGTHNFVANDMLVHNTYISAVIAKILREKEFQIYYLSASDISGQGIRKAFDDNSIMDRALAVDLLIIDDLNHATDKNVVYAILKYRSDNMLSTIISMRIKTKDLPVVTTKGKKKYSFPEYFERFYGELSPLVQGNILPIFINGENYRDKELNEYEKNMSI